MLHTILTSKGIEMVLGLICLTSAREWKPAPGAFDGPGSEEEKSRTGRNSIYSRGEERDIWEAIDKVALRNFISVS